MSGVTLRCLPILLLGVVWVGSNAAASQRLHVPGISGEDNRVISESRRHPWSAIGRLNVTTGGFCTATVIGPRQVLTAAHCLWNRRTARWLPPCALHFLAGYRRGEYAVHALVAEIHVAEGFRLGKRQAGRDWAVVTLDRDVSKLTGIIDLADEMPRPGDDIIQAGYSRDRQHVLTVDDACRVRRASTAQDLFTHNCDATFGDSGSPILSNTGQGYRLAGIHTALHGRGQAVEGVAVSARAFIDWVRTHPVTRPPGGVKACGVVPAGSTPFVASRPAAATKSGGLRSPGVEDRAGRQRVHYAGSDEQSGAYLEATTRRQGSVAQGCLPWQSRGIEVFTRPAA